MFEWLASLFGEREEHGITVLAPFEPAAEPAPTEAAPVVGAAAVSSIVESGALKRSTYKARTTMDVLSEQYGKCYQTPPRFMGTPAAVPSGAHPSVGVEPCVHCRTTGNIHRPGCPLPALIKNTWR